jgi:hypothetical protein
VKEYYIDFDSKSKPGKLVAVKVTVQKVTIDDMNKSLPINLCEDPLYAELERYILSNPSKKFSFLSFFSFKA